LPPEKNLKLSGSRRSRSFLQQNAFELFLKTECHLYEAQCSVRPVGESGKNKLYKALRENLILSSAAQTKIPLERGILVCAANLVGKKAV